MDYLRRFLLWFVSGLGLAGGVACIMWLHTAQLERQRHAKFEQHLPASTVVISAVEPITIAENVTVSAMLTNNAGTSVGVEVELVLLQGSKIVYACERRSLDTPAPGESARI
jgi:hypothetical protein